MPELKLPEPTTRPWRIAFGALLLLVLVLSLAPLGPDAPTTGWDKTNHLLAFTLLGWAGCQAHPGRTGTVMLALLAYGALIEVLQSCTAYRSAEWGDLFADALGQLSGWGLAHGNRAVLKRWRRLPPAGSDR